MSRTLYYPQTFFLDDLLLRRSTAKLTVIGDPVQQTVDAHIDNFLLLLLVFDDILIPLDNFQFFASNFSARVALALLEDDRFQRLAAQCFVKTNEHGPHDLRASWQLYKDRAASWSIADIHQHPGFDQIKSIPSIQTRPADESDRMTERTRRVIDYVKADGTLSREQLTWLDRRFDEAMQVYRDGTISIEHFAEYLVKAEASDFPEEKRDQLLQAVNVAFFQTFPTPAEGSFAYFHDSLRITDPLRQADALRAVLYSPRFLRAWLHKAIPGQSLQRLLNDGGTLLTAARGLPSWAPFTTAFHGPFAAKMTETFAEEFWRQSADETGVLNVRSLLDTEQRLERFFDVSFSDYHTSVKLASIVSVILSYRFGRRLTQRVYFPAIGRFVGDLHELLRQNGTPADDTGFGLWPP